jgi:hypothetical protein
VALAAVLVVAIVVNTRADSHIERVVHADKLTFHRWLVANHEVHRLKWIKVVQPLGKSEDEVCAGVLRPPRLHPRKARLCAHVDHPGQSVRDVWQLAPGETLAPG